MGKVSLLDCTLRDGGYINDWRFGVESIRGTVSKLAQTGIEWIEVGFIKGNEYNQDRSVFPDIESFKNVISTKNSNVNYVGMIDMSSPVPLERITPYDGNSIDAIRVIFKKNKIDEGYSYCKYIKEHGYKVFANFVSTDTYTDKEFIEGIELFNTLSPYGIAIVDTFGTIKKKTLRRLVDLADNNLNDDIVLCYHAHNNLQQAFGNAETIVEMNLKRDICIDACVFGMGRGAGNLNLELFAEYMNENYDTNYNITPMLNIMDEYLIDFYKTKFWGYSLPLYLSASNSCHPNYAIYLAEKNTMSVSAFEELMQSIDDKDKLEFSKEKAEYYYQNYFKHQVEDSENLKELAENLNGKNILLIAPGKSIGQYYNEISQTIHSKNCIVISVNYYDTKYKSDYIFVSNMRRIKKLGNISEAKSIVTSNICTDISNVNYVINYDRYKCAGSGIADNAGLMALKFLLSANVNRIYVAGMDGYHEDSGDNYFKDNYETYHLTSAHERNELISKELKSLNSQCKLTFITPTLYEIGENYE